MPGFGQAMRRTVAALVWSAPRPLIGCKSVGMGEPLANYKRVVAAVRRITDPAPDGLGISQRAVTVSTVGLAPAIRKLADEKMQVRLAVSLHTPDDELWDTLVAVNNRWFDEVLSAARYYADTSGRRVSIEYALIRDINDQPWRAELLAKVLATSSRSPAPPRPRWRARRVSRSRSATRLPPGR